MSMNANIVVRLQAQAMRTPAAPAIISDNQVLNFEQARFCAGVIAAHLKRQGVEPGQHVGVAMGQNSLHLLVLWAVAQIGAVSVPLHPAVPADRRLAAARKFAVAHVVSGREDMALPGLHFIGLGNLEFGPLSSVDHEVAPLAADAGFRVMMSSGTSGDPKGMMLTHGLMQLRGTMKEELCHPTHRVVPMDLNFVAGFRLAVHALMHGASVVLPRSLQAQQFLADVIRFGSTHLHLSPAQARELVDAATAPGLHCPSLLSVRIGGGLLPPPLLRRLRERICPQVSICYAVTEMSWISYAPAELLEQYPASAGRPCAWAEVEIVSDETGETLPKGAIGRLRVRSAHGVTGYINDEAQTRSHFKNGWFYTDDLGYVDADGLLYIEGRTDETLNIDGQKVNVNDLEAVLGAHPGVADAGCFVGSDALGHPALTAAVVLRPHASLEEVRRYASSRLGPLTPTQFLVVDAIPRTQETRKLKRSALAQ